MAYAETQGIGSSQLAVYTRKLRAQEKAFMASPALEILKLRIEQDPALREKAEDQLDEIQEVINIQGIRERKKNFEVFHEMEVARQRFLLELHKTGDLEEARRATYGRLSQDSLKAAAEADAEAEAAVAPADPVRTEPGLSPSL